MDIRPATLAQVQMSQNGGMVAIADDVLDIARQLQEIDPQLSLRWSEAGEYFVVYGVDKTGDEFLVLTAQELDQRVVERVRFLRDESYDMAKEMDRLDKQRDKEQSDRMYEQNGAASEMMAHAVRKDLGVKTKIFVPKGFDV